ncbi:protein NLP2-like [Malania oleifera]|uniref:protein NLP2-like n=1 Tax=Malania oleifera TaxID=397392 RepID=UPI0025ADCC24|nr:protein NLP2-like [Malania oleifera]
MEDGAYLTNTMLENVLDTAVDFDFMDELLSEGCRLETTDGFNLLQPGYSTSNGLNNTSHNLVTQESSTGCLNPNPHQKSSQELLQLNCPYNPYLHSPMEEHVGTQSQSQKKVQISIASVQSENFVVQSTELSGRWWIGAMEDLGPSSSVRERLMMAVAYMKESTKDRNALIQFWVPVKKGGKKVLTTNRQPFALTPSCQSLANYRNVSKKYKFPAEEDSKELVGLPGRVFLGKVPEWTPDVRFFRSDEYARVGYAQRYDVCGSLALPIFEQGSGNCLGVVEIVTTSQKINYRPELENVCKALEAVDLKSSEFFHPPKVKACTTSHQAALPEIVEILKSLCEMHNLPLAQTWFPCEQQGKGGCWHSHKNSAQCVSTIDSAFFAADQQVLGFHEACSEYHLLRHQGIVGRAFTTNQLCFEPDITAFSVAEYPLSHHARVIGLRGAAALRLQSMHTVSADFVLEFFLPIQCRDSQEQNRILNSLYVFVRQACHGMGVIEHAEPEAAAIPDRKIVAVSDGRFNRQGTEKMESAIPKNASSKESSWIAHMMKTQQKGKGVSVSLDYQIEEPKEEFKMTSCWYNTGTALHRAQTCPENGQFQQDFRPRGSTMDRGDSSFLGGHHSLRGRKTDGKRRTKTEKSISLQVLQQYFAGSLKDAAKSIGVCPTTLKRICRQHGITRWPSRKIKKVGHSLRKLQLVIDSVQGVDGTIQLSSFYTNFPELSSPNLTGAAPFPPVKMSDHSKQSNLNPQPEGGLFSPSAATRSPSSSCSQSSSSSYCCSTGAKQNGDAVVTEDTDWVLKRTCSSVKLLASNQEPKIVPKLKRPCSSVELLATNQEPKIVSKFHGHKSINEHARVETSPSLPKSGAWGLRYGGAFRAKATFGEEKVRFSLQQNWSFIDLQQEIGNRFNIDEMGSFDLKYLDDDSEWVLLTCDADLEECIDVHKSSQSSTIKLSVHLASHATLGSSLGSTCPS